MYPVTNEFQEKIKRKFDRRIFGRVVIDYTSSEIDQSVEVETNGNANVSYPTQVTDGISSMFAKYASLDGSWKLDGSYKLAPADGKRQMGWWSDVMSDAQGGFNPAPIITVSFKPRPIHKLRLSGDDKRLEYPTSFNVILYSGENIIHVQQVRNNTEVHWEKKLDNAKLEVTSMKFIIFKWSHPNRQAKISELFTSIQEIYEDKNLISLDLLEEIGTSIAAEGTISSNEIKVRLNNSDGKFHEGNKQSPLYQLLKPDRRIRPELGIQLDNGEKDFVPLGVFWSKHWKSDSKKVYAEVIGRDMLDKLMETNFTMELPLRNISLYDLALIVLKDANVSEKYYWIDSELKEYIVPYVFLTDITHREVLRLITEACLGRTYCSRKGIIRIEGSIDATTQYNVEVSERIDISKEYQVTDGIQEASVKTASLDGSWKLDGSYKLVGLDEEYQLGWWGNQLSNLQGLFKAPYPKVTISFLSKAISQLIVVGDTKREEYPVDYNIYIYNSDNVKIITKGIRDNEQVISQVKIPENPTNAIKVELEILKWSHPGRQAKIVEFIDIPFELDITKADYFKKQNPAKDKNFTNYVQVIASPLDENGEELEEIMAVAKDDESIKIDKQHTMIFPKNYLIQTKEAAQNIADRLLEKYSNAVVIRELKLDWRGNPALELGDIISIKEYDEVNKYKVVKNDIKYTGGLKANLQGRRLL